MNTNDAQQSLQYKHQLCKFKHSVLCRDRKSAKKKSKIDAKTYKIKERQILIIHNRYWKKYSMRLYTMTLQYKHQPCKFKYSVLCRDRKSTKRDRKSTNKSIKLKHIQLEEWDIKWEVMSKHCSIETSTLEFQNGNAWI